MDRDKLSQGEAFRGGMGEKETAVGVVVHKAGRQKRGFFWQKKGTSLKGGGGRKGAQFLGGKR